MKSRELLDQVYRLVPEHDRKRKTVIEAALLRLALKVPVLSSRAKYRFARSLAKHRVGLLVSSLRNLNDLPRENLLVSSLRNLNDLPRENMSSRLAKAGGIDTFQDVAGTSTEIEFHETDFDIKITPVPKRMLCQSLDLGIMSAESRRAWLAKHQTTILDTLWARLSEYEVLSLDVFDTFLLRGGESEAARFLEFSDMVLNELKDSEFATLLKNSSAESLTLARARGMQHTYRFRPQKKGCNEGSIIEVAQFVSGSLGGNELLTDRLLDLEVQFEAGKLYRNPVLSPLMQRFKEAGKKVILISDMYLHADHIERISKLVDPSGFETVDKLYSSADTILNKRSGKLFGFVEKDFGLRPETTIHAGDSHRSDVERAREAGWNAMYFPISRPEIASRQASLVETISHFDERGIDVRDWAKV